ncbi:myb-like protein I [Cydia fagiglandana]|uniref:myb-like protein I n=1 Tax=Cydia fagiglandana TaxID=1458189 RepID=UPI002FEE5FAD
MKNKYCTKVVDCLPGTHVMCLYGNKTIMGPRCSGGKMLPLTEDEKTHVLDILNEFKRNLAKGKEDLPKAYGMRKLFWDDSLAEFAQVWANQCDGGRHDLCRASEEFPSAGQAMCTLRFNYPDWSLQGVQFKDTSKTLTPEKRVQVIESFAEAIYETSDVEIEQIENYPSGDFRNSYLLAVHGSTTNVGCGMSSFHDYYRTADEEPIIFHAVEIVCNFSSQPKGGEKVYETKWSDGEGWTKCGCPDGFIEDDCLCVPGKLLVQSRNDTQSEDRDDQQNKDNDNQQKEDNKDKDDQQNKHKDNQQNTDKNNQQNKHKDDQQNKHKDDQQNKDKEDQQNKDKDDQNKKDKNNHQNKDKDERNKGKDDERNKGKDDERNKGKDDEQSKGKDDERNKGKDDEQNKGKDDQQKKDKDDRNNQKNKDTLHSRNEHGNTDDTCNADDPSCKPRVVIMPIITVENADTDR